MSLNRPASILRVGLFFAVSCLVTAQAFGEAEDSPLLLFPNMVGFINSQELPGVDEPTKRDITPTVDFFLSWDQDRMRFMAEYLLNEHEAEFERAQLGWLFESGTLWLGRIHNPIGIWNTRYHHGAFMQSTITRPGFIEFEDHASPLSAHATGLLFEGHTTLSTASLQYDIVLGAGPEYEEEEASLEAVDVLDPTAGEHRELVTLRATLTPDDFSMPEMSLFLSHKRIDELGIAGEAEQDLLGFSAAWQNQTWTVLGTYIFAHNELELDDNDNFHSAYLQSEYTFNPRWKLFARAENTFSYTGAYLEAFPRFIYRRTMVGARYELAKKHALKFEFSLNDSLAEDYSQFLIEWSAVFP